ncbi:MAG: glycosyltransferase [Planctomycetota bacterium]
MIISVVIPTSRRSAALKSALESCAAQALESHEAEILVVSNPPSQDACELVESFPQAAGKPNFRYIAIDEIGANYARNAGIEESRGDIVQLLDDDCILPHAHYLLDILRLHDAAPAVSGLGGTYVDPDPAPLSCRFYNAMTEVWLRSNRTESEAQLVLLGGNASYKRSVFDDGHLLDEALIYGGTETEFNHRLVAAGHRLELRRELDVVHDFAGTWRSLFRRAWKQGAGKATNPHSKFVLPQKDASARKAALRELRRPRSLFAFALAAYYATVQLSYRLRRRRSNSVPSLVSSAAVRES